MELAASMQEYLRLLDTQGCPSLKERQEMAATMDGAEASLSLPSSVAGLADTILLQALVPILLQTLMSWRATMTCAL